VSAGRGTLSRGDGRALEASTCALGSRWGRLQPGALLAKGSGAECGEKQHPARPVQMRAELRGVEFTLN